MIKIILISLFSALFIYGFFRPFTSVFSRLFLFSGSLLGILSVIGIEQTDKIANFVGVGRGADLFVYLSLLTVFLFISYTINRFETLNERISILSRSIALSEIKRNKE
tara:strand:+ start:3795 stop:4118 length:324 start_codon:yes stop_codon:yes gene_type:complete